MKWSVENQYRMGVLVDGRYVLLKDGSEVAYGYDAPELWRIADDLNFLDDPDKEARKYLTKLLFGLKFNHYGRAESNARLALLNLGWAEDDIAVWIDAQASLERTAPLQEPRKGKVK